MKNPLSEFVSLLNKLSFKPSDVKIYALLLEKGEMRVSEISEELGLSVRFVRERLRDLYRRGIVRRRLIERGWVGYLYSAEKPVRVLEILKSMMLRELEKLENLLD